MKNMQQIAAYFALLLATSSISIDLANGQVEDVGKASKQVFAADQQLLEPSATLELLVQLKKVHPDKSEDDLDEIDRIELMIESNEISEEKCTFQKFMGLNELIKWYSKFPSANIIKYLEYNRERLLDFCKPTLDESVKKAVTSLGEEEKKDAEYLIDLIVKNHPGAENLENLNFDAVEPNELASTLINFLESRAPHLNLAQTKPTDQEAVQRVRQEFDRLVGGLSRQISSKLRTAMEPYEEVMPNKQLSERVVAFTKRWFAIRAFFRDLLYALPSMKIMGQTGTVQKQGKQEDAELGLLNEGLMGWLRRKAGV